MISCYKFMAEVQHGVHSIQFTCKHQHTLMHTHKHVFREKVNKQRRVEVTKYKIYAQISTLKDTVVLVLI